MGPGSVFTAHSDDEHVPVAERERAVDLKVQLVRRLLQPPYIFSGSSRTST
jgi:hypothetical protein